MDKTEPCPLVNREISWLAFNGRVLQEAEDPSVPLLERLKFLAIFSSNLDEFFRVRVASLRSLLRLKKKKTQQLGFNPRKLLNQIHRVVLRQQEQFGEIFRNRILPALADEGVHLIDERRVTPAQRGWLGAYFREEVLPHLSPILVDQEGDAPFLENRGLYLVAELWPEDEGVLLAEPRYALVGIPGPPVPRFVEVPGGEAARHDVMFIDDVIRVNLPVLFPGYEPGAVHAVKLTRDAELYLDDEFSGNLVEMIRKSLSKRDTGLPTRFLYDQRTPYAMLALLKERLGLDDEDVVMGGRYHNFNDFFGFPDFGRADLLNPPLPPLPHPALEAAGSVFAAVAEADRLLHFPYQRFEYVLRFLDEAAADPAVEAIRITLYRVASDSRIAQALVAAARAGKQVTAFVEVKARFDEATNLHWADRMEEAGVNVLYSMPGLKVHAKVALVARREGRALRRYAYLGTGNFNEKTARLYADHGLLTADPRLTREVDQVFRYLEAREEPSCQHLLVAPFDLRDGLFGLIDREIAAAEAGQEAWMTLKMNSLEDAGAVEKLCEAARAGVKVRLIVRGICCLVPDVSENIEVTSIVDRFLEHARVYLFCHGGEERLYLASADLMYRNLSRRIEVAFPVYDEALRAELRQLLHLQAADNTKARRIDAEQQNLYVHNAARPTRAQTDTYRLLEAAVEAGPGVAEVE